MLLVCGDLTAMSQCPWVTVQYDNFFVSSANFKILLTLCSSMSFIYIQQIRAVPGQIPGELHLAPISNQNTVHLTQLEYAAYHTTSFQSIAKHFLQTHVIYQMLSENHR